MKWNVYYLLGKSRQLFQCEASEYEKAFEACEASVKGCEVQEAVPAALDVPVANEWCVKTKEAPDGEMEEADYLECRKFVDEFEAIAYAQYQAERGLDANLFHGSTYVRDYQ